MNLFVNRLHTGKYKIIGLQNWCCPVVTFASRQVLAKYIAAYTGSATGNTD